MIGILVSINLEMQDLPGLDDDIVSREVLFLELLRFTVCIFFVT